MNPRTPSPQTPQAAWRKTAIYFLSGTGNSHRVARWLEEMAKANAIDVEVIPVDAAAMATESVKPDRDPDASRDRLVALVFPTHGFTAPWKMIRFALRMPAGRGTAAFCVATRGALNFGAFTIPGAAGTAALLIGLILLCKGYLLRGIAGIDMPSNWMSLYSGFSRDNAGEYIARRQGRARGIFHRILGGGTHWFSWSNAWDLLLWGLPLLWLSALYLLIGRFFLAKLFFANNSCTACGQCARNCPTNAIRMVGRRKPRPYWKYNCESCMRCMGYCPNNAVEAGQSWLVILYLITSVPMGVYFFSWLTAHFPGTAALESYFSVQLVNLLYLYPSLFLSYYLFHWLIKIRPLNALFTCTTFTHLYPRYHEPDTRLRDLGKRPAEPDSTD